MKKIFILLLAVVAFASCDKESSKPKLYSGPLCLNGVTTKLKATGYDPNNEFEGIYSAKEVVKRAAFIQADKPNGGLFTITVADSFKDTTKVRIMIPSEVVVTPELTITEFCYCKNLLILDTKKDTIAYLRNADIKIFRDIMEVKMKEQDFRTLDLLFESTMYFNSINGRQYKGLKASDSGSY